MNQEPCAFVMQTETGGITVKKGLGGNVKENENFWKDLAVRRDLTGTDLRLIMFCYGTFATQKDIQEHLQIKKPNVSRTVNKLCRENILERVQEHGIYFYRANCSWSNTQLPGQRRIEEYLTPSCSTTENKN